VGDADDGHLLRRAASGDEAATADLVRRYVRRATLFARQLVGDSDDASDDAEDVVAEAFVIALDRAATFRSGESVGAWLYGIVRRVAAKYRRRASRRRWLLERWRPEARRVDPAQLAAARDALDRVAAIVSGLPDMQRQCFGLVVYSGLDITEVATMFDIAPSTVRQHVHRAREAIRARFPDFSDFHA
jgi:RNA polymerase sigma-70 factor (ECF subfamily)